MPVLIDELHSAWVSILVGRRFDLWAKVADIDLPIPVEFVRTAAYFRYLDRAEGPGSAVSDWVQAESELRWFFRQLASDLAEDSEIGREFDIEQKSALSMEQESAPEDLRRDGKMDSLDALVKGGSVARQKITLGESEDDLVASQGVRAELGPLSPEERRLYFRKVLAIDPKTNKVIAVADTADALREKVRASGYCGVAWRLVDGPQDDRPLSKPEISG